VKVAELLESRRKNWQELEALQAEVKSQGRRGLSAERVARFSTLHRAACADLALADSYELPPGTVAYLHRLVARSHSQLYRSRMQDRKLWIDLLFVETPQRIFRDRCMQIAFCLFWGVFLLSAYLAYDTAVWPDYADQVLTTNVQNDMLASFRSPMSDRPPAQNMQAAAGYINHNTGIGLKCFATGLLIIPGLYTTIFNAAFLGAAFGFMARDPVSGPNFFNFVTAHGPFELTAICVSSGAGLRLGVSWLITEQTSGGFLNLFPRRSATPGLGRLDSLRKAGREAMPMMVCGVILFFLAALTEGFLSPSSAPYIIKAMFAILSSGLLMFYFLVLGFPRGGTLET